LACHEHQVGLLVGTVKLRAMRGTISSIFHPSKVESSSSSTVSWSRRVACSIPIIPSRHNFSDLIHAPHSRSDAVPRSGSTDCCCSLEPVIIKPSSPLLSSPRSSPDFNGPLTKLLPPLDALANCQQSLVWFCAKQLRVYQWCSMFHSIKYAYACKLYQLSIESTRSR
jgi:hypothetical protein